MLAVDEAQREEEGAGCICRQNKKITTKFLMILIENESLCVGEKYTLLLKWLGGF